MRHACLLTLALSACGSDGGPGDGSIPDAPTCEWGDLAVVAALDGETTEHRVDIANYAIGYGSFDLNGSELELRFDFDGEQPEAGQTYAMNGTIDLSDGGGPTFGNCADDGFVSEITFEQVDPWVGTFVLREVHAEPYCDTPAARGAVVGCFYQ